MSQRVLISPALRVEVRKAPQMAMGSDGKPTMMFGMGGEQGKKNLGTYVGGAIGAGLGLVSGEHRSLLGAIGGMQSGHAMGGAMGQGAGRGIGNMRRRIGVGARNIKNSPRLKRFIHGPEPEGLPNRVRLPKRGEPEPVLPQEDVPKPEREPRVEVRPQEDVPRPIPPVKVAPPNPNPSVQARLAALNARAVPPGTGPAHGMRELVEDDIASDNYTPLNSDNNRGTIPKNNTIDGWSNLAQQQPKEVAVESSQQQPGKPFADQVPEQITIAANKAKEEEEEVSGSKAEGG